MHLSSSFTKIVPYSLHCYTCSYTCISSFSQQLIKGVGVHGKKTWSKVCQYVPGRTQSQCRERYLNVLDSDLKKGHFTMEEDRILLEACQPYEGESCM